MTQLSQEDKDFLDDFFALLRQAAITGSEVSMLECEEFKTLCLTVVPK
ncbi:MAG: hypothetical protein IJZ59_01945 [Alphaproteobacteria bacterium]|nr:hypothetical protein [Alphaproteobacteria bacterium]